MVFFPLFLRHHFEGETSGGKMLAVFAGQPIQSNPALQTPHYYGQFSFSLGKVTPHIFFYIQHGFQKVLM